MDSCSARTALQPLQACRAFNSISWILLTPAAQLLLWLWSAFNSISWIPRSTGTATGTGCPTAFQFHFMDSWLGAGNGYTLAKRPGLLSIPFHGFRDLWDNPVHPEAEATFNSISWILHGLCEGARAHAGEHGFQFHFMDSNVHVTGRCNYLCTILSFQFHFMDSPPQAPGIAVAPLPAHFQFHFMDSSTALSG